MKDDVVVQIETSTSLFGTIDPGMNGHTGFAVFNIKQDAPVNTGIIKAGCREKYLWDFSAYSIARDALTQLRKCQQVFIELPEFWGGSSTSYTSAAKGDLFKLTFLVGNIFHILTQNGILVTLFSPRKWKGQLKKEMVDDRIKRILNMKDVFPDHVSDAVGMGLFVKGLL